MPASCIPLACSVEAIPACIYIRVSRIRFILLVFTDVPLHALLAGRDHSFIYTKFSMPKRSLYKHTIFNSTYFQVVMRAEFGGRHTGQCHEMLRCGKIQLGHNSALVHEQRAEMCFKGASHRRSKDDNRGLVVCNILTTGCS